MVKFKCSRCGEDFFKPETGKVRKLIVGSRKVDSLENQVLATYFLCPTCATNFTRWLKYIPRKKTGD